MRQIGFVLEAFLVGIGNALGQERSHLSQIHYLNFPKHLYVVEKDTVIKLKTHFSVVFSFYESMLCFRCSPRLTEQFSFTFPCCLGFLFRSVLTFHIISIKVNYDDVKVLIVSSSPGTIQFQNLYCLETHTVQTWQELCRMARLPLLSGVSLRPLLHFSYLLQSNSMGFKYFINSNQDYCVFDPKINTKCKH